MYCGNAVGIFRDGEPLGIEATCAELNHLHRALLSACASLENYAIAVGLEPKAPEAQMAYYLARTEAQDAER